MLAESRSREYSFEVPKFDINARDVKNFHNELKDFMRFSATVSPK